jgi:hypothetical protein
MPYKGIFYYQVVTYLDKHLVGAGPGELGPAGFPHYRLMRL